MLKIIPSSEKKKYNSKNKPDDLVLPQLSIVLEQPDAKLAGGVELSVFQEMIKISTTDLFRFFLF